MRIKAYKFIILIALILLPVISGSIMEKKRVGNFHSLPSLPKPIAKEYVLITSAGQSTDVYIINDIANKQMIHNYFMPQAKQTDLEGISTLVVVVGYSELGAKLHSISFEDEKSRISELIKKAEEKDLVVISVYIGGKQQIGKNTKELLDLIIKETDYLIATKEADNDGYLSKLAKSNKIPITLINGVSDLSEPFASAFR